MGTSFHQQIILGVVEIHETAPGKNHSSWQGSGAVPDTECGRVLM
jgi:hypothetical protein